MVHHIIQPNLRRTVLLSNLPANIRNERDNARRLVIIGLIALLPFSLLLAISLGTINISFSEVIGTFFGKTHNEIHALVVEKIRLPRALLAAFVGALLAICGATTQGLFRNPLADPSLIGVTAGASVGASITIFGMHFLTTLTSASALWIVSGGAFIGGAIAVVCVYSLATNKNGTSVATMLLAGIAITAIAGGVNSLIEFFADNEALRRISLWKMGGLEGADAYRVSMAAIVAIIVLIILPRYAAALNALLLGESEARHLGISVQKTKLHLILLVALAVGVSVALAGSISFVGLVVPHIIRLMIGPNHRYLLPLSALGGASLLLLADVLARTIVSPIELPVGLVTALLGAPFFISLLRQRGSYGVN